MVYNIKLQKIMTSPINQIFHYLQKRDCVHNRAELLAVITAMKIYDGNLEIRSDSDYVVRAANCRMRGEIQRSNLENSDLWKEFDTALSFYGTRQVKFTWVKGHATLLL